MTNALPRLGRRRSGRRKGQRHVVLYDTDELLEMFVCADVDDLLARLDVLAVVPHVSFGPGGSRVVFVSDYQLPDGLIAVRS